MLPKGLFNTRPLLLMLLLHTSSLLCFGGLWRVTLKLFMLSTHCDSSRRFPHHCHIYYCIISYVGLLGAMSPLKVEIIHIVPIVNDSIYCHKVTHGALSVFTQAARYRCGWINSFTMEQNMCISLYVSYENNINVHICFIHILCTR